MDAVKTQISKNYEMGKFTFEDIEALETYCQQLIANEKAKRDKNAEAIVKEYAWDDFVSEMGLDETIPLVLYVNSVFGMFDHRSWTGYYTRDGYHAEVSTTPYLDQKNIYLISLSCTGDTWFSDNVKANKTECKKRVKELAKFQPSKLFKYVDCSQCDDQCGCSKLDQIGDELLEEELGDKKIKPRAEMFVRTEKDVVYLMKHYITIPGASHIYKEDDYFGNLE